MFIGFRCVIDRPVLTTVLLCLAGWAGAVHAAETSPLPPVAKLTVDFDKDIHPILAERCFDCHGTGKSKGGFTMESRDSFIKGGESGPAVVVGKSEESHLIKLVSGLEPDKVMPAKGPRLSD